MKDPRIEYACESCGGALSAPPAWAGRRVACPVCGHVASLPEVESIPHGHEEPDADVDEAIPDIVFMEPPAAWQKPVIPAAQRPGFFRRYRLHIIVGAVLLGLGGWWASWRWYYHNYVKAEAIMKNRGYGTQLSEPLTNDPKAEALVAAVLAAEQRQFADTSSLDLSIALAGAYEAALNEIKNIGRSRANHIMNNAAWLFATTPHLGLRDNKRALALARAAVAGTDRREPGYLDTLAEALAANGRTAEALDVAREALRLSPDDQYLIDREIHFADLAGR